MSTMRENVTVAYGSARFYELRDAMHSGRSVEWKGEAYAVARCDTDLALKEANFLLLRLEPGSPEQTSADPEENP